MNGHAPHLVAAAGGSRTRASYSAPSVSDDDELDLEDEDAEEDPDVRMLRDATGGGGVVSHVMPQPLPSSSSASAAAAPDLAAARPQSPPPAPSSQSQSQSDLASSRISTLLLRGYSLLGETCPRQGCVGVPLMGQPTTFARRNRAAAAAAGRKECVICGTVYGPDGQPVVAPTAAQDAGGPATLSTDSPPAPVAEASVDERKAALYNLTTSTAGQDIGAKLLPGPSTSSSSPKQTKKRAIEEDNGGDHNEFGHRSNPTALASSVPSASISRAEQALSDLLDQMTSQMRNKYLADAGAGAGSLTSANRLTSLDLKALLERMKEVMEALEVARRVRA